MNTGVSTTPRAVSIRPARARHPGSFERISNFIIGKCPPERGQDFTTEAQRAQRTSKFNKTNMNAALFHLILRTLKIAIFVNPANPVDPVKAFLCALQLTGLCPVSVVRFSSSQNQHCISVAEETIALPYRLLVGGQYWRSAGESRYQQYQAGFGR